MAGGHDVSLSGSRGGALRPHAAVGVSGRWLGLVGSMWLLGCAGNSYNFAIYSSALKDTLALSQAQLTTLSVAKDVGDNVGLLAGLLADLLPSWAVIVIGLSMNTVGYGFLWSILSGRMQAAYWQVWLLLCMATNGASFFITAGLVTAQRNFPSSGGIVAGIVVGFIGLSGALFAQIYDTFLAPNTANFLLLVSIAPALVGILCCFIVKPCPPPAWTVQQAVEEHRNLRLIMRCCLLLAAFLLGAIVLQSVFPESQLLSDGATTGMLFLLILPALSVAPATSDQQKQASAASTTPAPVPAVDLLPPIAEEDGLCSGSEASSVSSASRRHADGAPSTQPKGAGTEIAEASLPSTAAVEVPEDSPSSASGTKTAPARMQFGRGLSHIARGLGRSAAVGNVLKSSPFAPAQQYGWSRRAKSLHSNHVQSTWAQQAKETRSFSHRLFHRRQTPPVDPEEFDQAASGVGGLEAQQDLDRDQSVEDFSATHGPAFAGGVTEYQPPTDLEGAGYEGWGFYFGEDDESLRANRPLLVPPKSLSEAISDILERRESPFDGDVPDIQGLDSAPAGTDLSMDLDVALSLHGAAVSRESSVRRPLLDIGAEGSVKRPLWDREVSVRGPETVDEGPPALGEDHTFGQALQTLDFWLLYSGLLCGFGCGLAAISNLAQIGESLGYGSNVQVFTSLLSIWQFLGRLASGSASEYLTRRFGLPRPYVLAFVQTLMVAGLLSFSFNVPGALYVGSLVVGFAYGGLCSLMPVTAGELFGLNALGMIYNTFLTAAPAGSFFLSGILVGKLYQREADRGGAPGFATAIPHTLQNPAKATLLAEHGLVPHATSMSLIQTPYDQGAAALLPNTGLFAAKKCYGEHCFHLIFLILTAVCTFGSLFHIIVAWRTRSLYAQLKCDTPEPGDDDAKDDAP